MSTGSAAAPRLSFPVWAELRGPGAQVQKLRASGLSRTAERKRATLPGPFVVIGAELAGHGGRVRESERASVKSGPR
ncbi:hypothetical protein AAFF_G00133590 [Aldrovandia affinis]|uniref:Uncharacterized protein n=1 Tax=Aldrovandia affinis TaxID=143900 RepID=A0AAD7W9I6_9TELE|nr:hypothetical protein AAFF_G00133590 [Aldrovandia affinis]